MPGAVPEKETFTYADYRQWPEDQRWELLDGVAYDMTPAPSTRHQALVGEFFAALRSHFEGSLCRVLVSPVDVLLPRPAQSDDTADTVVQPDVLVVCEQTRITERFVRGAPELVVEVLSPATAKKDEGPKRDIYERAGVKEYWLVHPTDLTVNRYSLVDSRYGRPDVFGVGEALISTFFRDLQLPLEDMFGSDQTTEQC